MPLAGPGRPSADFLVPCRHTAHRTQREASFSKRETTSKTLRWCPPAAGIALNAPPPPGFLKAPSPFLTLPCTLRFPLPETLRPGWQRRPLFSLGSQPPRLLRPQTRPGRLPPAHLQGAHPHLNPLPPAPAPQHPVEIGCSEPSGPRPWHTVGSQCASVNLIKTHGKAAPRSDASLEPRPRGSRPRRARNPAAGRQRDPVAEARLRGENRGGSSSPARRGGPAKVTRRLSPRPAVHPPRGGRASDPRGRDGPWDPAAPHPRAEPHPGLRGGD